MAVKEVISHVDEILKPFQFHTYIASLPMVARMRKVADPWASAHHKVFHPLGTMNTSDQQEVIYRLLSPHSFLGENIPTSPIHFNHKQRKLKHVSKLFLSFIAM